MNKFFILFLTIVLSVSFVSVVAQPAAKGELSKAPLVRQAALERSPGHFDPVRYQKDQQERFDRLMAEAAPLSPDSIVLVEFSSRDMQALEDDDCTTCGEGLQAKTKKVKIGVVKSVGFNVNIDVSPGADGFQTMPDGGYVLTRVIQSPGATALRVHFDNINLPTGAELYIYNANGEAFGPYTGMGPADDGDFWSNTVSGSLAYIQLRHYGAPSQSDLEAAGFSIADVGILGEKFLVPFFQERVEPGNLSTTESFCSYNEPCIEDASCHNNSAVNAAKDAVAHMQWVSGAFIYYCSGGLVADTDSSSQIPYFITANHCLSKNKDAKKLECFWQYATSNCGGSCYDPVGAVPRTLGSDVISSNRTADYTLLQLWENPPSGSAFLGWTTANVANSNNTNLFRISHPSGAPQAYSSHRVDTSAGTCGGWPRGNWIYSRDLEGSTEGGSSGSPVVNSSGQLVGQLSGGCGTNVNDVCDAVNNATVDGAFAAYYSSVSEWLDPDTTPPPGGDDMHVDSISLSTKKKGPRTDLKAAVTIVDDNGNPVSGATVTGTYAGYGSDSDTTNSSGVANLKLTVTGNITSFSFCVDNVSHSSYTYDSGANVETCDSI
ncbi:MAG: hypothetical protein GY940_18820 [bacterium]|nr:hypothetical protein [bacterium]